MEAHIFSGRVAHVISMIGIRHWLQNVDVISCHKHLVIELTYRAGVVIFARLFPPLDKRTNYAWCRGNSYKTHTAQKEKVFITDTRAYFNNQGFHPEISFWGKHLSSQLHDLMAMQRGGEYAPSHAREIVLTSVLCAGGACVTAHSSPPPLPPPKFLDQPLLTHFIAW